jgi:glycosyltransferase involved in cell wall biosynthesis
MKKLLLIYGGDFETYPMGGVLEYVKNFARYFSPVDGGHPEGMEISLVGLTLDPQVPLGKWRTVRLGDVERAFLPIYFVDEERQNRSRVPLNYKFMRAFRRYRPEFLSMGSALYIQRAEHAIPFMHDEVPIFFNTHGQSGFLVRQTQHPLFKRGWFRWWFYRMEAKTIRRVQKVITISPADYDYYVERFPQWREKFACVPLGVETDVYVPVERQETDSPSPTVLFVGRLHPSKGLDLLIEAFALFRESYPDAKLILVGGSQDFDPIEAQVQGWIDQFKVREATELTGLIPRERILPYYQSSDLFVLTSLWEGLPNALLEAMACGLPAVVTAVGGLPSVVQEDMNGYLIGQRDPRLLAEKMKLAYENRHRLSNEARRTAEGYSICGHVKKVRELMGLTGGWD